MARILVLAFLLCSSIANAGVLFFKSAGGGGPTGNDFSGDSNCVALYRFESGALTTDSKSTNTLTNVNTVTANTTTYKEGSASADFELDSSQYFTRTDSSLTSDFPLKSGTTNKTISVVGWIRLESYPASGYYGEFVRKYGGGTDNKRCFDASISGDTHVMELTIGYNSGASAETVSHASALSLSTWYHFTISYKDSDKSYAIRIRDTSGNTVGTDLTGTMTLDANKISLSDTPLSIGAGTYSGGSWSDFFDGLMDEVAVFNDVISSSEATQIAQGVYAP